MTTKIPLPIDEFIPEALKKSQDGNLVITAAPGAGKTTRLPAALLSAFPGKILVLEPRRMAAIAAAHRIADENGWQIGREVGYQVRFANKTSPATRLIFMTEALLARQMMRDPELAGVDAVILDEFHERSLHVDLTLGLLRELQELGRPLHLMIMSATLEAEKIADYLGQAPILRVPGKLFELEIKYQKNNQWMSLQAGFYENLFATIKEAQSKTTHDILVFLPGLGEIERAREMLTAWAEGKNISVLPLHGSLPLEEQRAALQKSPRQRILLSTNIAESSVTIDGVNTVIDSGLAKVMRQDLRTGFSRLELSRISLSSAVQRAGRAARQYPGTAYRLWNKMDELSFAKSEVPEILRSDLSESLLFLAAQGVRDFSQFSWFEKPGAQSLDNAVKILRAADALNDKNELTETGRKLLHFPLPVRLARIVLSGVEGGQSELAAQIAALLQERDILKKESLGHFIGDHLECDLTARLEVLEQFLQKKSAREAHFNSLRTVAQSYQQILGLTRELKAGTSIAASATAATSAAPAVGEGLTAILKNEQARQGLLLSAYSDRLCRRRKNSDRALMVGGRGVKLAPESLVRESEFFIALNGVEGSSDAETLVSLASGIDKDFLLKNFAGKITRKSDIVFNEEKGVFFNQEYKVLYDLPLEEAALIPATAEQITARLPEVLTDNWESVLKQNQDLARWREKVLFLKNNLTFMPAELREEAQALWESSGMIARSLRLEAFTQAALGEKNLKAVAEKDLIYFFEGLLSPDLRELLKKELPAKLQVPSQSWIPIRYPSDKAPYMEVRIQEIFGWTRTPKIMFQKIPVVIHLLGPNFRPVQITNDLESFWKNGYPEVRKELRLKYPKHQWPENPADGVAEAKGRRRH